MRDELFHAEAQRRREIEDLRNWQIFSVGCVTQREDLNVVIRFIASRTNHQL